MTCGVLIGASSSVEWMIPWWARHYYQHNHYPVAFLDLGVSEAMKKDIQSFEHIITPKSFSVPSNATEIKPEWKTIYPGNISEARKHWFAKPSLLLQSPFDTTIWIDIDCEIRSSIEPLFDLYQNQFAIAQDSPISQSNSKQLGLIYSDETLYNGGVIAYDKNAPLLKAWIDEIKANHHLYFSDQEALSRIIYKYSYPMFEIPYAYNARPWDKEDSSAKIIHYANIRGKIKLLRELMTMVDQ